MKITVITIVVTLAVLLPFTSCKKGTSPAQEDTENNQNTALQIYVPREFASMDLNNNNSTWSYKRSRESAHFIVFWGAGYGSNDPNSEGVPEFYRVDIDDLLAKAEDYYKINIEQLKFAERGVGKSNLDKYKMMIFLHYTAEWMAYGGGYDDVIGALWINPATCKPVGATVAHEIGHSFQYQVRCDLGERHGFRYGFGGDGGNGFWEQTAQWQAYQSYPAQAFSGHDFTVYTENYHRHIHHEWQRYASYFIHWYWADKRGIDIIGKIWREAIQPEDPVQAYMRITGISTSQLNDELYEAAARFVTWDIPAIRTHGRAYIGRHSHRFVKQGNGSFRVAYDHCPGTTGYNVIPLEVPAVGTLVLTDFRGIPNANGFNTVDAVRAGWRYGYVALLEDGTRVYGDRHQNTQGTAQFTVPPNCKQLWLVVTGAPSIYSPHAWDEDEGNDEQWPYELRFTNTSIVGFIDTDAEPRSVTLQHTVTFPYNATDYSGANVVLDGIALGQAFSIQPNELSTLMSSGAIKFYAIEADGTLNATTTANGYGHWFTAGGNVTAWGANAVLFSELNASSRIFSIGQYPAQATKGISYTFRQALVYTYQPGKTVQATLQFHVHVH